MWVNVVGHTRRKDVVTPAYNNFGYETIIYDFQTDENQNERYVCYSM